MLAVRAVPQCLASVGKIQSRSIRGAEKRSQRSFAVAAAAPKAAAPKAATPAAAPAAPAAASTAKFAPGFVPTTKAEKQQYKELAEKEGRLGSITQVFFNCHLRAKNLALSVRKKTNNNVLR